jgi:predicted DNA-binding transcriptional regulator YafY
LSGLRVTLHLQEKEGGERVMTPNERRNAIIQELSFRRFITYSELSYMFEVSVRTIQRDVIELTRSHPIKTTQGCGGGISLPNGYYVNDKHLNNDEVALLQRLREGLSGEDRVKIDGILKKFAYIEQLK